MEAETEDDTEWTLVSALVAVAILMAIAWAQPPTQPHTTRDAATATCTVNESRTAGASLDACLHPSDPPLELHMEAMVGSVQQQQQQPPPPPPPPRLGLALEKWATGAGSRGQYAFAESSCGSNLSSFPPAQDRCTLLPKLKVYLSLAPLHKDSEGEHARVRLLCHVAADDDNLAADDEHALVKAPPASHRTTHTSLPRPEGAGDEAKVGGGAAMSSNAEGGAEAGREDVEALTAEESWEVASDAPSSPWSQREMILSAFGDVHDESELTFDQGFSLPYTSAPSCTFTPRPLRKGAWATAGGCNLASVD